MPIEPKDLAVLMKYLEAKFGTGGRKIVCPVCHTHEWIAEGPVGSPVYTETPQGPANLGPGVLPAMVLICKNCSYLLQFSWLRMRESAGG